MVPSTSTAAALKGVFLAAICFMLLHSSMGQEPAPAPMPPSDCPSYCTSRCTPICQANSDAAARRCESIRPELAYPGCFEGCSSRCTGNSAYARGSCGIGSCTASSCGSPCERRCCESCTGSAYGPYSMCMATQPKVFSSCMMGCTADCHNRCANGSVP
ncbi:hypothetical protein SEVIR_3G308103v4 [Setaria viridis]|uniref:Uncharacterized protein n=1 Tax=Setaria viridis TaxID=4556 RepID=A0A4U6VL20_SETVI|nr:hypothetical protein SEVIR_3G308103v2 [Setaria viridis]